MPWRDDREPLAHRGIDAPVVQTISDQARAVEGMNYQAPWWLPGGHAQTIWAALCARTTSRLACGLIITLLLLSPATIISTNASTLLDLAA